MPKYDVKSSRRRDTSPLRTTRPNYSSRDEPESNKRRDTNSYYPERDLRCRPDTSRHKLDSPSPKNRVNIGVKGRYDPFHSAPRGRQGWRGGSAVRRGHQRGAVRHVMNEREWNRTADTQWECDRTADMQRVRQGTAWRRDNERSAERMERGLNICLTKFHWHLFWIHIY